METTRDYFDALSNILRADGWRTTLREFCREHARAFSLLPGEEFGHRHFDLWREFQDLAESILDSMLAELGGSMSHLEKEIDRRLELEPAGPAQSVEQEVLTDLLSFGSFEQFADMMRQYDRDDESAADSKAPSYRRPVSSGSKPVPSSGNRVVSAFNLQEFLPSPGDYGLDPTFDRQHLAAAEPPLQHITAADCSQLETMGFSPAAVDVALIECKGSVDAALAWLLDHPELSEARASDARDESVYNSLPDLAPNGGGSLAVKRASTSKVASESSGASETGGVFNESGGDREEEEELAVQAAIARSILQADEAGHLGPDQAALVPWARDVAALEALVVNHGQRCTEWRRIRDSGGGDLDTVLQQQEEENKSFWRSSSALRSRLRVKRLRADLAIAKSLAAENDLLRSTLESGTLGRSAGADNDILRIAYKNPAETSSCGEDEVAMLLARKDELYEETARARAPVMEFTQPPHSIGNQALEEAYLFLRELVHTRVNLPERRSEIDQYVVQERLGESASYGSGLLSLMLLLMGHEDELMLVSQRVRRLLNTGAKLDFGRVVSEEIDPRYADDRDNSGLLSVASSALSSAAPRSLPTRDSEELSDRLQGLQAAVKAQEAALIEAARMCILLRGNEAAERAALKSGYLSGCAFRHQALVREGVSAFEVNGLEPSSFFFVFCQFVIDLLIVFYHCFAALTQFQEHRDFDLKSCAVDYSVIAVKMIGDYREQREVLSKVLSKERNDRCSEEAERCIVRRRSQRQTLQRAGASDRDVSSYKYI